jgi:putative toxin-antitoxin system antitoxin component (TIGR02293 family)
MRQKTSTRILEDSVPIAVETALQYERKDARRAIDEAQSNLGLSLTELAKLLDVDRRTILRYRSEASAPSESVRERIAAIRHLMYLLGQVFPTIEDAKDWLYSPVPSLQARRPIDLLRSGKLDEVLSELAGLDGGVFS